MSLLKTEEELQETVEFSMVGNPVPQGRPRAFKMGKHIRMYDPKNSRVYKEQIRMMAQDIAQYPLWEGPLYMHAVFWILRPKSVKSHFVWRDKKPDSDNLLKPVKDALEGIVYRNDSQIAREIVEKPYGDVPGVWVKIGRLNPTEYEQITSGMMPARYTMR